MLFSANYFPLLFLAVTGVKELQVSYRAQFGHPCYEVNPDLIPLIYAC